MSFAFHHQPRRAAAPRSLRRRSAVIVDWLHAVSVIAAFAFVAVLVCAL